MNEQIVISGLGLVTPFASTPLELGNAACDTRQAAGDDWFDAAMHFGTYGYKNLMPACRYGAAATQLALQDAQVPSEASPGDHVGVAMGTNFGNHPVLRELDTTVRSKGSQGIRPLQSPNFSLNLVASNISIRHQFTAFNITLTNPVVAGLQSVALAARQIQMGRAKAAVAGAMEDTPPALAAQALGVTAGHPGAAVVYLEAGSAAARRGHSPHAAVVCHGSAFVSPHASRKQQQQAVSRFLERLLGEQRLDRPIAYVPLGCQNEFCLGIAEDAHTWLSQRRAIEPCPLLGGDGAFMSVSPMLLLSGLAAARGQGIVFASNPFGEITLIELGRP